MVSRGGLVNYKGGYMSNIFLARLSRHEIYKIVISMALSMLALSNPIVYAESDSYVNTVSAGGHTFKRFCSVCHGDDAKGDGSFANNLTIPPPDLTLLSSTNGNEFPWERVFLVVEGKNRLLAHGTSEMPIWGELFDLRYWNNKEENAEVIVRGRIFELLAYLNSIQDQSN